MKKLLLTGANGFLGSYFYKQYSIKYDIKTFSFVHNQFESLSLKNIDTVIHLGALVHQTQNINDEMYETINVTQTLELAQKAKEDGVQHFIFMSTVKVYGEGSNVPYNDVSPCVPLDAYGKSKLKAEQKLQSLGNETFHVSIIRTPIIYGYGVKANMQNLIKLVDKMSFLPFGGIDNKRSFVYIGNLCALIDAIICASKCGVFLAGDDEALSTSELISLIANAKQKKIYLLKVPFFKVLLKWFKPSFYQRLFESLTVDIKQTNQILNFKNPYSIREGIKKMVVKQ